MVCRRPAADASCVHLQVVIFSKTYCPYCTKVCSRLLITLPHSADVARLEAFARQSSLLLTLQALPRRQSGPSAPCSPLPRSPSLRCGCTLICIACLEAIDSVMSTAGSPDAARAACMSLTFMPMLHALSIASCELVCSDVPAVYGRLQRNSGASYCRCCSSSIVPEPRSKLRAAECPSSGVMPAVCHTICMGQRCSRRRETPIYSGRRPRNHVPYDRSWTTETTAATSRTRWRR